MPPRLSEEQRRARKQQLAITATLTVVLGSAWLLGPGLRRVVVPHARAHRGEPWAAEWLYRVAQLESHTLRREQAQALYVEIWRDYAGDELSNEDLLAAIDAHYPGSDRPRSFLPWEVERSPDGERPPWVGGEGAQPHPRLADALLEHALFYEDHRLYVESTYLFRMIDRCFPGTPAAAKAQNGLVRVALNPYAPG